MVHIYTQPGCAPCRMTKKKMDTYGIEYVEIDLIANPEAMTKVKEMGFRSAPVVETPEGAWSGFKPERIAALAR